MMNKSFDDLGRQFAWDSTSIKLAEDCLYKYKLIMIDGWQPKRKSVHLLFGGWYASALEHYHKFRALGQTQDEALVAVVREALIATWEYEYDENNNEVMDEDDKPVGKPWASDHPTKTRENLIRTIIWYVDYFRDEVIKTIHKADGTPCVELSFSFEIEDGLMLSGHLDRLVEYAGETYVMDQKTTGSTLAPYYFDQFDPDTQMSLYTYAGQVIFNSPVKGVIIDAAQIAVGSSRFLRGFTFRDQPKLDEWYSSMLYTIERARTAVEDDFFPLNPSSCNKYAGCRFRGVCSRSPTVREQFLKADFVQGETWDPLTKR